MSALLAVVPNNRILTDADHVAGYRLLDKHGLTAWTFSIENLRNTNIYPSACALLGYCDHSTKTIRIDHSANCKRHFRQTVLHEIAHALADKDAAHGQEWRDKAEEIGCTQAHLWPYALAEHFARQTAVTR